MEGKRGTSPKVSTPLVSKTKLFGGDFSPNRRKTMASYSQQTYTNNCKKKFVLYV